MNDFTSLAIVAIISFIVGVIITREIFGIPLIVRHTKTQTALLAKIARQQGVSETEIQKALEPLHLKERA